MRLLLVLALLLSPGLAAAQSRAAVTDGVDRFMLELFDRIQKQSIARNIEYCGLVGFDADGELRGWQHREVEAIERSSPERAPS